MDPETEAMKGSLITVALFALGCIIGYYIPSDKIVTIIPPQSDMIVLALLMCCVGYEVGRNPSLLQNVRQLDPRILLLPLMTIVGSVGGAALVGKISTDYTWQESAAVGSGMAYYSLSSILISQAKGATLGTIALLSNILREIIALLAAPLFFRFCGRLVPISVGGATTMDTTLPIILSTCGKEVLPIALFHGFITDLSVPFLVSLFCSL